MKSLAFSVRCLCMCGVFVLLGGCVASTRPTSPAPFSQTVDMQSALRDAIFVELSTERDLQDKLGYSASDDRHTVNDWVALIVRYTSQAQLDNLTPKEQRKKLLEGIAIGVAALETFDRNKSFPERHYDK